MLVGRKGTEDRREGWKGGEPGREGGREGGEGGIEEDLSQLKARTEDLYADKMYVRCSSGGCG